MKQSPIRRKDDGRWIYHLNGRDSKPYSDKLECAKEYVRVLMRDNQKYQPLLAGRKWPDIFRIVGINMEGGNNEKRI